MSTTVVNKQLIEPAYGDPGWATTLNNNLSNIDSGFGGNQIFNLSSASGTISVIGTTPSGAYPGTPSFIPLSWTLSTPTTALAGNVVLQLPSGIGGQWVIYNNCSQGSYSITVSASGGSTSVTLVSGSQIVYSDGAGNVRSSISSITSGSSNNQIIVNSSGSFSGSSNLTFNGTILGVTGAANITGNTTVGGTLTVGGNTVGTNAYRNVTISSSAPSGGNSGDIWYQV